MPSRPVVAQRAVVEMKGKNFGSDPKDFPTKNVWTTVASSKDIKVHPRTRPAPQPWRP